MSDKPGVTKASTKPNTRLMSDQEIVALQKTYPDQFPQFERAPLMQVVSPKSGTGVPAKADVGYAVSDVYRLLFSNLDASFAYLDHSRDGYVDPNVEARPDAVVMHMANDEEKLFDAMSQAFRGNITDDRWALLAWKKVSADPFVKHWLTKAEESHAQHLKNAGLDPRQQTPMGVSLEEIRRVAREEVLRYAMQQDADGNGLISQEQMQKAVDALKHDVIDAALPDAAPSTPHGKKQASKAGAAKAQR